MTRPSVCCREVTYLLFSSPDDKSEPSLLHDPASGNRAKLRHMVRLHGRERR